ncbi:TBC-domain-containing protein, partial [Basidiobolus meristosporus CBS 931.73]
HYTEREMYETLKQLKSLILSEGIPDSPRVTNSQTLRCRIWKILLGVYQSSATEYISYVEKGRSHFYDKIRNDTFRTLATDKRFLTDVGENKLIRVLNAFVWKHGKNGGDSAYNWQFTYVQGMNVLAAPFLYALPEVDAFHTFDTFLQYSCPLYVQPALQGVHCGLKLLDVCLKFLDLKLYTYLREKNLSAEIYAFPSVLTFCVCTPPLSEAIKLWDFLLSFGVHLNILCIVAQLQLIREEILVSSSPMKLLRTLPDLNARVIINATTRLIRQLPQDLYGLLARHPYD